jgi:thiamine transport system permease protein
VAAVAAFAVLPLAALLERSLRVADGYGLQHWSALGQAGGAANLAVDPVDSVVASLRAAIPAASAAVLVGVPAAVAVARSPRGLVGRVLLLPLAISATTIGLGLLLVAGRPPLDLRRSPWLVLVAQALVALPLVVRATVPAFSAQPRNVIDSARLAGAGHRRLWWRVQLPMARPAVVAAAGLALIVALGEFGATVFVARTSQPTVPVAIERLLSRPGEAGYGQAMALSVLLAGLCAVLLWAVDRAGGDRGVSL